MRTLFAIIEAAKSNEPATVEELRYALCAVDGLSTLAHMSLRKMAEMEEKEFQRGKPRRIFYSAKQCMEERFNRWHKALNMSPREYLGESFNPENTEYQERRAWSLKLADKVIAQADSQKNEVKP